MHTAVCMLHKITHPGDNIFAFGKVTPGVISCGVCVILCRPGDNRQAAPSMKGGDKLGEVLTLRAARSPKGGHKPGLGV